MNDWWMTDDWNVHSAYIELNLLEDTSMVSLASCIKVKAAVGPHAYCWADEAALQNWVIGSVHINIWWHLPVVPMWGAAGMMSTAGIALAGLRASLLLLPGLPASFLLAQSSEMIKTIACITLQTFGWTFSIWMEVPTLIAAWWFGHGIYMQRWCCSGYWGQISATPLFSFLILLTVSFKHFTMWEECLICKLGLVLLSNPVPGLMVLYSMLQDHKFKYFSFLSSAKFWFGDEVTYVLWQCTDPFIWLLLQVRHKLIPVGPKCSSDFIVGPIASNAALGVSICSGAMTPPSIRLWRAFLSSPSNMSLSCFQPLRDWSAVSSSMSRASR